MGCRSALFYGAEELHRCRIIVVGDRPRRKKQKRADYLLRFTRDFTIAVVEAKPKYRNPGEGLQQAKEYAEILGLKFAYATNGEGIVEFDYATGKEQELSAFPSPEELWSRYCKAQKIDDEPTRKRLLTPYYHTPVKRRAIIRRSPSIAQLKPFCRARGACF